MIELHNSYRALPEEARGTVLAIGNLDGLHPGHAALVATARAMAAKQGAPLGVMTFEPHPREFFDPNGAPFRLTLLPQKKRLMNDMGVQHLFALTFDADFAALTAEDFIQSVLVAALQVRHVVVGADFAFGKGRKGSVADLQKAADDGLFGLTVIADVCCDAQQESYSSTRIRAALAAGDLLKAEELLGRPWEIEAPVVHGDKRGRALGFPTANQQAARYQRMPFGIYAVEVMIEGENVWRAGVANFGIRPMFRIEQPIFETFIFDFTGDLYDKNMRVRPRAYLRAEKRFDGLPALMTQMKQDCLDARAVLKFRDDKNLKTIGEQ